MERALLYLLAIANITVGFLIYYRGADRFGFDTYRSYLNREERMRRKIAAISPK